MKLVGAKEFLKSVKPGTLCVEFWEDNVEQCLQIIKDYNDGKDILKEHVGEFYIFGDNSFSLGFLLDDDAEQIETEGKKYDGIFIYDKNIVGDAVPQNTLQLVFENESEYPNEILVTGYNWQKFSEEILTKNDIIKIRNWFLKEYKFEPPADFVWKRLNNIFKDDFIVNYKSNK